MRQGCIQALLDVAVIFGTKRIGVIFQMIEDEQIAAVRLACHPDPAGIALRQNFYARRLEISAPVFCVARNGHRKIVGKTTHQPLWKRLQMVTKDAKQLFAAIMLWHLVEMIEKRLRPPADAKPPETMRPRPVHDLGQLVPIGNLLERQPFDGRTGHNQRIEILVTHILKPAIEATKVARLCMARRIACRRHQDQLDLKRRVAEQAGKLDFRVLLLWHQVEK